MIHQVISGKRMAVAIWEYYVNGKGNFKTQNYIYI